MRQLAPPAAAPALSLHPKADNQLQSRRPIAHSSDRSGNAVDVRGFDFTRVPLHGSSHKPSGFDFLTPDGGTITAPAVTAPTAPAAPAAPGPTSPPAPAPVAPLTVALPAHIRGSDSPPTMADRIPPRVDTSIGVNIGGLSASSPPVAVSVDGAGGGNGALTINGAAQANLNATATVKLRGTTQTGVGNAGNLKVVAKQGTTTLATSGGFSVSSIPQDYTDTFVSLVTGTSRGFVVQDGWSSDSGTFADLDHTEISELVEYGTGTGCFVGATGTNSGYLPGNALTKDTHSRPVAELTSAGTLAAAQVCQFRDNRSGSVDIPMRKSGFKLTRKNEALAAGGFQITTSKVGAAQTAHGVTSAAGTGSITKVQAV